MRCSYRTLLVGLLLIEANGGNNYANCFLFHFSMFRGAKLSFSSSLGTPCELARNNGHRFFFVFLFSFF